MSGLPADALGLAALVFLLGLRHGLDPDHLAAIDGLTRAGTREGARRWCGLFFALGHGVVITLVGLAVAIAATEWEPAWGARRGCGRSERPSRSACFSCWGSPTSRWPGARRAAAGTARRHPRPLARRAGLAREPSRVHRRHRRRLRALVRHDQPRARFLADGRRARRLAFRHAARPRLHARHGAGRRPERVLGCENARLARDEHRDRASCASRSRRARRPGSSSRHGSFAAAGVVLVGAAYLLASRTARSTYGDANSPYGTAKRQH